MNPIIAKIGLGLKKAAGVIIANKVKSIVIGSAIAVAVGGTAVGVTVATRHEHVPKGAVTENLIDATCTDKGSYDKVIYCSDCGDELSREQKIIPAIGHLETTISGKASTCTEQGYSDSVYCYLCDTVLREAVEIPLKSHTYDDSLDNECNVCGCIREVLCDHSNAVVLPGILPTCTTYGLSEGRVCLACGEKLDEQQVVPSLGHDIVEHEANAAGCTTIGWDRYDTCTRCDYTTYFELPSLGHNEIEREAKEPSCAEVGWDAHTACSRCEYTTRVEIPALGHDEVIHESVAPDCTTEGCAEYVTCTRCDYTTYIAIPPLGHDEIEHDAKAAGCYDIGWEEYVTCSRCDYTTYIEIEPTGHTESVQVGTAPTCTENGLSDGSTCSTCGEVLQSSSVIPAAGHSYDDNRDESCNVCGYMRDVYCTHENISILNAVAPTCESNGWKAGSRCNDCFEILVPQIREDALGHDEIEHEATEPTCTTVGNYAYVTCSRCNYTTYSEIPAL